MVKKIINLGFVIAVLFFAVSVPLFLIASAKSPVAELPLQERADYQAGYKAGAARVQGYYDERFETYKKASLCVWAKLARCPT